MRVVMGELRLWRLFIVESTTDCYEYHRDEILTEEDLADIEDRGITVHVDSRQWSGR